jgi:hypothetical protein
MKTENLTLIEAIHQKEKSDRLKRKDWSVLINVFNGSFIYDDTKKKCELFDHDIILADWQIIPAEPKVLTPDEILDRYLSKSQMAGGEPRCYNDEDAIFLIMNSHKNGRLERDLELKKHIEKHKSKTEIIFHYPPLRKVR